MCSIHIQPQRFIDGDWRSVEPPCATAWLARAGSKLARFSSKRAAQQWAERELRLAAPQRRFTFAGRCPPRLASARLLATSINHEHREHNS
jgi:hypothetical protein